MEQRDSGYEAPRIEDHGDLIELTAESLTGNKTDKGFPAETPAEELTFTSH